MQYISKELRKDKDIAMAAVQQNVYAFKYVSEELKNNRNFILSIIKKNGLVLEHLSFELRNDKEIVEAIRSNRDACYHSLLEKYSSFDSVLQRERKLFLFSCWKSNDVDIRFQIASHINFLPTIEQIEVGLKDWNKEVRSIYQLRQD